MVSMVIDLKELENSWGKKPNSYCFLMYYINS